MSWSHQIDIILDVDKRVEPLLLSDGRPTKMLPLIQGSKVNLRVRLAQAAEGSVSYITPAEGDAMAVCGMRRSFRGDVLYSIPAMDKMGDDPVTGFEGLLNLHTIDLDEAVNGYPQIDTTLEVVLTNEAGSEIYRWQMLVPVVRKTCVGEPPIVSGGPSYYTQAQSDALFARKDAPDGYAVKLVEHGGLLYWAQAVGTKWVIQQIIKVGDYYTSTFIDAGDVE